MISSKRNISIWFCLLAFFLVLGGFVSVHLGQDANWDLKNYHLYNAWSYLHKRLSTDIFAAGAQSYFAPLLDIPYYLLSVRWLPGSPRLVAFIMGLPYGLLLFIVFSMAWVVAGELTVSPAKRASLGLIATVFGVTGVATVSQVGTTFNEIPTAATTLAGLLFIILAITKSSITERRRCVNICLIFSGLLFGAAAGLKLTACIYAPGAAIVAWAINGSVWRRFQHAFIFSLAWVLAFSVLWGPWGWKLYKLTGNPFFPLFNSVFHSSWIAPSAGLDLRFMPKTIFEAIFYPFYWINNPSMTVMEPRFADPRFAMIYALGVIAFIIYIPRLIRFISRDNSQAYNFRSTDGILLFSAISYPIWQVLFSILRYAATLESILGLVMLSLIAKIVAMRRLELHYTLLLAFVASCTAGAFLLTKYPDWGRAQYSNEVFKIKSPRLPNDSLILFVGKPIAYLAPFLAHDKTDVEFIGITSTVLNSADYKVGKMIRSRIAEWPGPIFYVARRETMASVGSLKIYSLYPDGNCKTIFSNIDEPTYLCRATKTPNAFSWPSLSGSNNYVLGSKISMTESGSGHEYVVHGWSSPESWGTWSDASIASLMFRLPGLPTGNLTFEFKSHAFLVPTHQKLSVSVFVNGQQLKIFDYSYPQGASDSIRTVNIPANLVAQSKGLLKIEFLLSTPVSPEVVGLSTDDRQLGIGMIWLRLSTAHEQRVPRSLARKP
ncbi:MAG: hypothetical protein KGO02_05490 [Alphaproteobacteria bacterium]|nr:hypothetical protein [Alphaproteobacteria bacterium]